MTADDFYQRRAGVLLHPTSLPSGRLDEDAERWLDTLHAAGFSVWQVLPLGEPQSGLSPYTCVSAFAMNHALLDRQDPPDYSSEPFHEFCASQQWLRDYATFKLAHRRFGGRPWCTWPDAYRHREPAALEALRRDHAQDFLQLLWQQYQLHERWQQLRRRANALGILLFGDMPLFVAHDSADVWARPGNFLLDAEGRMTVVTGVPPDYYSATGQRWGNPHYNWDAMQEDHFEWWLQRVNYHLEMFDIVRIDHFRGLEASWVVNAASETAIDGEWQKMPGDELLAAIRASSGHLPIVAEDLGVITPEVTALRRKYHLPGMAVMQFGFDAFEDNPHKPKNIKTDQVVYTGTHDNDTTRGWFEHLDVTMQDHVLEVLDIAMPAAEAADAVVDRMVDRALGSNASLCMLPLQDVLHLGSEARMNTPGTVNSNWRWSFQWDQLESKIVNHMRQQIETADRLAKSHV
jgi:4-alpha-glucanotransferase